MRLASLLLTLVAAPAARAAPAGRTGHSLDLLDELKADVHDLDAHLGRGRNGALGGLERKMYGPGAPTYGGGKLSIGRPPHTRRPRKPIPEQGKGSLAKRREAEEFLDEVTGEAIADAREYTRAELREAAKELLGEEEKNKLAAEEESLRIEEELLRSGPARIITPAELEEKIKAEKEKIKAVKDNWLREKERELRDIKELAKELGLSELAKELAELEDTLKATEE